MMYKLWYPVSVPPSAPHTPHPDPIPSIQTPTPSPHPFNRATEGSEATSRAAMTYAEGTAPQAKKSAAGKELRSKEREGTGPPPPLLCS